MTVGLLIWMELPGETVTAPLMTVGTVMTTVVVTTIGPGTTHVPFTHVPFTPGSAPAHSSGTEGEEEVEDEKSVEDS